MEPPADGVESRPLAAKLRDAPAKITNLLQGMAKSVSRQVLAIVKSLYPKADLSVVVEGIAADCSDDAYKKYLQDLDPVAEEVVKFVSLE